MFGSIQTPIISLDGNQVQEMIAPVQDTLIADRNYTVGQQFILNGTLYKVTTAITSGNPIIISGSSANCELADTVTEQIKNLDSGLQVQQGSVLVTSEDGTVSVTFEHAFRNTPVVVVNFVSPNFWHASIVSKSTTGFTAKMSKPDGSLLPSGNRISWVAINI